MCIHCIDPSLASMGEFEDVSKVEKYVMDDKEYDKRDDSFRKFKERQKKMNPNFKSYLGEVDKDHQQEEANAISVGQPTVTAQVKSLEGAFDVELFHRAGKSAQLTDTGETLYGITRTLFGYQQEAIDFLRNTGQSGPRKLRIGAANPNGIMPLIKALIFLMLQSSIRCRHIPIIKARLKR